MEHFQSGQWFSSTANNQDDFFIANYNRNGQIRIMPCFAIFFWKICKNNNESILCVYCLCKLVLGLQHIMLTVTQTLHRNSHCWGDNGRAGVRSGVCANTSTDDRWPKLLLCLYMTAEGVCEASGLFRVCFKLITFIHDSGGTPRGH